MSGQIAGYVRVSSVEQNPDRQVVAIGEVDETFTDKVSGKGAEPAGPPSARCCGTSAGATPSGSHSMDRLARSVVDLAQLVQDMTSRGVRVEFVTERLTFDPGAEDPFATFQLHLLGAVAQLERSLIRERQREGIDLAKAKGVYRGRARKLSPDQAATARQLVNGGVPKAKVARDLGCSRRVLYELLAGRGAYASPTKDS